MIFSLLMMIEEVAIVHGAYKDIFMKEKWETMIVDQCS